MNVLFLLPDESQLDIDEIEIEEEEETIVLSVSSIRPTAVCPLCGIASNRVHSRYQRQPADLPFAGYIVRLKMAVRRFFCDNNNCERTTFAERIPSVLALYARRTNRLASQQQQVAFALGGEAGSRLLTILRMPVSPDTLLRFIRNAPEPEVTIPQVLGVDDWAKRKGHSYGTVLIDLETHQPVDLLPDRSANSLAEWLKAHPGIEIISRDRGKEYIKGITEGAPDAIQVADRWHLLKNLRESLEKWLETKRACLKAAAENSKQEEQEESEQAQPELEKEKSTAPTIPTMTEALPDVASNLENSNSKLTLTKAEKLRLTRHARRLERYEAVKELHAKGLYKAEIARLLKLDPRTVYKYVQYVKSETCPVCLECRIYPSKLDPYKEYISQRWQEGCHNVAQILKEIRKLGFNGGRTILKDWIAKTLKTHISESSHSSSKVVPWTARRASWLLMKRQEELSDDDRQALERMKQVDNKVTETHSLVQRFVKMVREREHQALLSWLENATKSGIEALKQYAKGIKEDLAAVANALCLPWSQGQVEGQVNRLKLIKRQMYGRAKFDLLRKRVLATPT